MSDGSTVRSIAVPCRGHGFGLLIRPLSEDNILNGFLELGVGIGACSVHSTHRPGIAVPPGTVHPLGGVLSGLRLDSYFDLRFHTNFSDILAFRTGYLSDVSRKNAQSVCRFKRTYSCEALPLSQ